MIKLVHEAPDLGAGALNGQAVISPAVPVQGPGRHRAPLPELPAAATETRNRVALTVTRFLNRRIRRWYPITGTGPSPCCAGELLVQSLIKEFVQCTGCGTMTFPVVPEVAS